MTFTVTKQPGDNFRVAASCNRAYLDACTVTNTSTVKHPADGDLPTTSAKVTDMLTVWRKLQLEVDSMGGVTGNVVSGTGDAAQPNVPTNGQSTLDVGQRLPNEVNRFEDGTITITNLGSFIVLSNTDNLLFDDDVVINGVVSNSQFQNTPYTLVDDDDQNLPSGFNPILPRYDLVTPLVIEKFKPAYIDVVDAATLGLNTSSNVAFSLNEDAGALLGTVADDAKDLQDSADFWVHLLVAGYQDLAEEDRDPDEQDGTVGSTVPSRELTLIHLETIRDSIKGTLGVTNNPNLSAIFQGEISVVVLHETGHPPGGQSEAEDHNEGGLMGLGASTNSVFTPATLNRFRSAIRWQE